MEAVTNGELRELLLQVYNLGWEDREAAETIMKRLSLEDARRRAISNLPTSNLFDPLAKTIPGGEKNYSTYSDATCLEACPFMV
jgi:hypothetical protein